MHTLYFNFCINYSIVQPLPSGTHICQQWWTLWQTTWALSHTVPGSAHRQLQILQAVPVPPTPVLSLSLSSEAWASVSSPCTHQQAHISAWGDQRGVLDPRHQFLSVLPVSEQLLCCVPSPWSSFCLSWSPCWWRGFSSWGNFSSFTAPSLGCRSCPNSFHGDSFCNQASIRSSPEFTRYSVKTIPHIDVFLMYLW